MRTRWLASGAIAMGLVAAGCGGSGDTAEPAASSTTTAATGSGSGCSVPEDDASLTSLLSLVPDTPENRGYVVVSNLRAFLDDQDANLPDPDRKVKFVDPVALFNATDLLQKAIIPADDVEDPLKAEYGISIADVDQAISAGEPPDLTELFVGSFDPAQVQSTVTSEPEWSADLEEESSDGLSFYAWGEDNETQLERRTTMRELGIGGRLMVSDSVAGFTRSTPVMEDLIEACTGAAPTLADDEAYAGIAERLDEFDGAFNTTFTDQVADGSSPSPRGSMPSTTASDDSSGALEGVTAYGYAQGPSDDPEQARLRLVIASETSEQATANEALLADHIENGESLATRQPWSEIVSIESIEADGRFLVVELRADNSGVLDNNLMRRDSLIVTGG